MLNRLQNSPQKSKIASAIALQLFKNS